MMTLAFGAVALFLSERGSSAQLVWTFGCGLHAGIGFMWLISPQINARWRREMDAEVKLMVAKAVISSMRDAMTWSPPTSPDDEPRGRRLQ